jgi:uncharacterized protein YndB with AHSA1/START domain
MSSDQLTFFDKNDRERSLFEQSAPQLKPITVTTTKTINAPAQQVFDQWLIPVFIGEWMVGPKVQREKIINLENKVRKGGDFKFMLNRKGQDTEISGELAELDIPKRLVMTWRESTHPDELSQVIAQFDALEQKTKLKVSIKLPAQLSSQKENTKKLWTIRLTALAEKFK